MLINCFYLPSSGFLFTEKNCQIAKICRNCTECWKCWLFRSICIFNFKKQFFFSLRIKKIYRRISYQFSKGCLNQSTHSSNHHRATDQNSYSFETILNPCFYYLLYVRGNWFFYGKLTARIAYVSAWVRSQGNKTLWYTI